MHVLQKNDIFPSEAFHINETVIKGSSVAGALHRHDFFEVFIVEEGTVEHRKNGGSEALSRDSVSFIFPEDLHSFSNKKPQTARFVNLAFTPNLFSQALALTAFSGKEELLKNTVYLPAAASRQLIDRLFWLRNECSDLCAQSREAMTLTLLADILTLFSHGAQAPCTIPHWLKTACDEMKKTENLTIGLPRFIELSGKTQEHLGRCMKKYLSLSPSEFINDLRLEQAAKELRSTQKTVFDIMLDCGFQNASYFNKRFKEKFHLTPTKYRFGNLAIIGKSVLH